MGANRKAILLLPADTQRTSDYRRSRAAGARAMLEDTRDPKVRAYLAEIAQEYERLAQTVEEQASAAKDPPKR
jgi:hypothetical protein